MPWPGRDDDGRADTTSVWAWIESPGITGAGKAISSKPRLATVVPSVVSNTDRPMSSDSVNRLLTTRVPNSVVSANDSSRCSGCAFMVRTENSVLSASVIVRDGVVDHRARREVLEPAAHHRARGGHGISVPRG